LEEDISNRAYPYSLRIYPNADRDREIQIEREEEIEIEKDRIHRI